MSDFEFWLKVSTIMLPVALLIAWCMVEVLRVFGL